MPQANQPSTSVRGEVVVTVDNEREIEAIGRWFNRWGNRIRCVDNTGCGCCRDVWNIEAPQHVFDDLPADLRPHHTQPISL